MAGNKGSLQLIVTAFALVAVLGLIWYLRQQPPVPASAPSTAAPATTTANSSTGERTTPQSTPGRRVRLPQIQVPGVERIDPEQRAQLLKAIQDKLAEKKRAEETAAAGGGEKKAAPGSAPAVGSLDKEYIRARIKEIVPLVKECFEMNYDGRPNLEVKLVDKFVIEGADELGGIVTSSEIVNQEAEQQFPELAQCVRETMYALRMKAPDGGGVVIVNYPFIFRSDDSASQPSPPGNPGGGTP
jgi:hypothetical protein